MNIANQCNMRVAVGYKRVSTPKQKNKGVSLENQNSIIEEYVKNYNSKNPTKPIKLDRILEEVKSASKVGNNPSLFSNRPKLQEIIRDATLGKITDVIVYCRDRLNRNFPEWIALKTTLKKLKVNLHFASTDEELDGDISALNEFYDMMMSNIAMFEAGNIGVRTKSGLMTVVENGFFPGGKIPFGYKLNKTNQEKSYLSINKSEALVVKNIFSLYSKGKSYREILKILNEEYPNLSSKFNHPNFIQQILNNEIYTGTYLWNRNSTIELGFRDEIIRGPAIYSKLQIISNDEFIRAQELKTKIKENKPKYFKTHFLLKGLLICGKCNSNLICKNNGKGKNNAYYCKCGSKKWTISIKQNDIEELVISNLINCFSFIDNEFLLTCHREYLSKYKEKISEINSKITMYSNELSELENIISKSKHIIDTKPTKQSEDSDVYTTDFFNIINTSLTMSQIKKRNLEDLLELEKSYLLKEPLSFDKFMLSITSFKNELLQIKEFKKDDKNNLRLYRIMLTEIINKIIVNSTESGLKLSIVVNFLKSFPEYNIKLKYTCPNLK